MNKSLIVLARHLQRHRPTLPPESRPLVSTLVEQLYSYDANPEAMRPRILKTIDRITLDAEH